MAWKKVFSEFANKPRENHSIGYGAMLTYLGLSHGLTVPRMGLPLEDLALGIGVMLLVVGNSTSQKWISKKLPGEVHLPKDITTEKHYFWIGLTLVYIGKDVFQLFTGGI